VVFLISDFIGSRDYERALKIANRRHDVIAVRTIDPLEKAWPKGFNMVVEDAETGENIALSGRSRRWLGLFSRAAAEIHYTAQNICERAKVDMIEICCGEDYVKPLMSFFRRRRKRV